MTTHRGEEGHVRSAALPVGRLAHPSRLDRSKTRAALGVCHLTQRRSSLRQLCLNSIIHRNAPSLHRGHDPGRALTSASVGQNSKVGGDSIILKRNVIARCERDLNAILLRTQELHEITILSS